MTRRVLAALFALLLAVPDAEAQREFRQYEGMEYMDMRLPPDWETPAEFVTGRLMYPSSRGFGWGRRD